MTLALAITFGAACGAVAICFGMLACEFIDQWREYRRTGRLD